MIDLRNMTDDEIDQLIDAIREENRRRHALDEEAEAMDRIQQQTQSALGIVHEHGVEWVAPDPGDHSAMYARNQVVTHLGEQHISLVPYNHWEPDPSADHYLHTWKAYSDPTSGPVEWDPERQYTPPAAVIYKGKVYELIHTHSLAGWEPDDPALHTVWREVAVVEPEPEPDPEPEPEPEPDPEPEPEYPAWDPAATYEQPAFVTHLGKTYELINTHAQPGWEPGDPSMHSVWLEYHELSE